MATPRIDRMDRNHIINGGMDFWQRVGAATTTVNTATTANNYTSDRIYTYSEGATVKNYSILRSTSVPTVAQAGAALPFSKRFNCLTAIASPAAGDLVLPNIYHMEGQDAQALYGRTVTFGFWINTNVQGNHSFAVINFLPPTRSYVTSFNIASGELSAWVFKTVTIPLESTGAIDNTRGLSFYIGAASGSNFQTSVGSWQTGSFYSFSGAANLMSLNTNFMSITGLQLVIGSTLPSGSFVRAGRSIAHELQLCQRYFEAGSGLGNGDVSNGNIIGLSLYYKADKRAVPTGVWSTSWAHVNGGGSFTPNSTAFTGTISGFSGSVFGTGGVSSRLYALTWTADAEL